MRSVGSEGVGTPARLPTPPHRGSLKAPASRPWVGWPLLGPGDAVDARTRPRRRSPRRWRRRQVHGTPDRPRRPGASPGAPPWPWSPGRSSSWSWSIVVVLLVVKVTRGTDDGDPAARGPGRRPASSRPRPPCPAASSTRWGPRPAGRPRPRAPHRAAGAVDRGTARAWSTSVPSSAPTARRERWALVVALEPLRHLRPSGRHLVVGRRGLPGHAHLQLRRGHLPEPLRHLSAVEEYGGPALDQRPGRVPLLHHPTPLRRALMPALRHRRRACPATGTLPFVDIGNRSWSRGPGSGSRPGCSRACRWARSPPTCPSRRARRHQAILGAANELVGGHLRRHRRAKPAPVCTSAGRRAPEPSRLGL